MTAVDIASELEDMRAHVPFLEAGLAARRADLIRQLERSAEVYGRRINWPASSETAVRALEVDVHGRVEALTEARRYLRELEAGR